jgi:hypothetical protein
MLALQYQLDSDTFGKDKLFCCQQPQIVVKSNFQKSAVLKAKVINDPSSEGKQKDKTRNSLDGFKREV